MTMTHKPVMVATDLSARCDRPIERAVKLAQDWSVKLIVLHVLDPALPENPKRTRLDIETQILDEVPPTKGEVEVIVQEGVVADTINKVANEKDCGIIVTGVASYNSLGDIFLGHPVDKLIRHAEAPVLVVKRKPVKSYKNIVIATDFSNCSMDALNVAASLFPEAALHLVHAYHVPYETWLKSDQVKIEVKKEEHDLMDQFLAKHIVDDNILKRLDISIDEGNLGTVLSNKIEETKSDLLVLGTHGRSGFMRATIGSNAKTILGWAVQDVLMVRGKK